MPAASNGDTRMPGEMGVAGALGATPRPVAGSVDRAQPPGRRRRRAGSSGRAFPWSACSSHWSPPVCCSLFIWGRKSILPPPRRGNNPLPRWRCARLIAAAPIRPAIAIASVVVGVLGFVVPLAMPDDTNDALHTAGAALLGMACVIPLAALLLAASCAICSMCRCSG